MLCALCVCSEVHDAATPHLDASDKVQENMECQVCHAVVSYIRAALANQETEGEIKQV
jgi:Saposin-like type B, region 1